MKKMTIFLCLTGLTLTTYAQRNDTADQSHSSFQYRPSAELHHPFHGVYVAGGGDGAILSFANVKENNNRLDNIPRFSLFFNIGSTVNYDFSNHAGFFSGLNLKNIGFITRDDTIKIKRRVYTLGIPVGFKFGNFNDDFFFYFGGEYELALNYKEKHFAKRKKVLKFNEWFSDRTPLLMPSLFAGIKMHHFNVKVQYYPANFFNSGYREARDGATTVPYEHTKADMFFVSFGYSFKLRDKS